ncbi:heavy metal efflux system protein [Cupriavidus metallidurans]|jgi:cobalt-zinc-cadmium resistance protein CzcA|uniref:efflux RND transporter permease subunit n=1 Tax=Cupriavidus TaxID=106589 RepID=UPI0004936FC7|nr:CusA/CzcA family heavy metal efflux RND transporter [Cupriavidus metallidurans]AVA35248.1 CusA/CzcA family heavy metal efflux RND transporter [Cupriavidus metallidurans]KWW34411.1 Cobalt-zinc-cadmium resistance protein CzcA [Cupriavidus metallidurans]MDE4921149.1 CusA/CzcA family heavy metal efflux RND transporter [Cupriavidus metallidurans]
MVGRLIDFSLRQRPLVLIAACVLAAAGAWAYLNLPIDAFPDISPTQVKVVLKVPGMTPEEVEQRVSTPIEQELLGIPHKTIVRSVSKYGISDVTVDFEEGVDVYWARQQVSERMAGIARDLPSSAVGGLAPVTTPLGEMFMFTVDGDGYSLADRRRVLDWVIRPALRTVPGVADVNSLGGEVRSYEVIPDPARLRARGVTLQQLRDALDTNNRNDGAGRLEQGDEHWVVRVEGGVRGVEDLRTIVVESGQGMVDAAAVTVGDVATVKLGEATRNGAVTQDGRGEVVEGLVLGLRGTDARKLVDAVQARLDALAPDLPKGMTTHVFYNRGELVSRAANTVVRALIEASLLVVVLLYLFLGGVRAALVVAATLPLSMLATFLLMRYVGLTANLMSLGGLAIALGMLVDAAVVVVENIETALAREEKHGARSDLRGAAIRHAVTSVATPMLAGVSIIAIVFLPLLSLQGLEGKLFSPVALTIVLALASSIVIAFTVVPALASLVLKAHADEMPWMMRKVAAGFARLQQWSFAHRRAVFGVAGAALLLAVGLYVSVGKTFMPSMDEGDLIVQLQKAPSVSLAASLELDQRVQRALLKEVPEIRSVVARSGSDDLGLDPMGLNETDTFLVLKPKDEWRGTKDDIAESIRKVMERFPGVVYGFTQPIEMRVSEMLTGTRGDVAIKIFGNDLASIDNAATAIAATVRKINGVAEVIAPSNSGVQYMNVVIDRAAAGQAGFSGDALQAQLRALVEGDRIGVVPEGIVRTPLILRGGPGLRQVPDAFTGLLVTAPDGKVWPLTSLARIERIDGPVRINHEDGARFAVVQVNVSGRDLAGFVQEAQTAVNQLASLKGLRIVWGGQFENQQRAAARLALVVPLALGAIFLLLMLTFRSVRQAVLIIANIPFALVGGIAALRISGEYLSVPASVGFIALLGIAVLNGVVLVSHFNALLDEGHDMATTVRVGVRDRLRPVLMTACIAALGMIPLLLASGPGSEIQRPLAIVVSGGLVTSTALTLLLLPLLFERFGVPGLRPSAKGEMQ